MMAFSATLSAQVVNLANSLLLVPLFLANWGVTVYGEWLLLIALPVLRVAIMMVIFLFEKDYRFAAISAAVLGIIGLGFLLGTMNSHIDFL